MDKYRSVGGEAHIELNAIGPVGDGKFECLDSVIAGVGRYATVTERQRSA